MTLHLQLIILIATLLASASALSESDPEKTLFDMSLEELLTIKVSERQPYRGALPLELLPQAVDILPSDFLRTLGVSSFQEALDFSSVVARQNSFGGLWDAFAIRGFSGDDNLPSSYFVNGFSAGRGFTGRRDISNIQSIEVLKGAGATFYGHNEPGGTINIITKKPQFQTEGYIQASAGSYDNYRMEGDYTRAASDKLAWRINGAYEDAGSFRNIISSSKLSVNPSLLYRISESSHVSYELEVLDQKIPFDRGVVVLNNNFDNVSPSRFYGEPKDGPIIVKATGQQLVFQHDFRQQWSLLAGLGYRESSLEGYSSEAELSASRQLLYQDGETLTRQRRFRNFDATDLSSRIELNGEFNFTEMEHHLLLGLDAYHYQLTQLQRVWEVMSGSGDATYSVPLYAPIYGQPLPEPNPFWDLREREKSIGVYVQDQIDISKQWQLLAGFRFDKFNKEFDDFLANDIKHQSYSGVDRRLGVNYQPSPSHSLYLSYSEGFRPNSGTNAAGDAFEPEHSKSYEMGLKFESRDKSVNSSIAIYRAEKTNILTNDPLNSGFDLTVGRAESQGLDIDLNIKVAGNNKLFVGYLYVDAHTVNNMINPDWGVEIPAGSRLVNIPKQKANLTLIHELHLAGHKGKLGASTVYVDDRVGETIDLDYILPSYTQVRVFSSVKLTDKLQLSLEINNLFNKQYFPDSYSALWTQPGSPRTVFLKICYDFANPH